MSPCSCYGLHMYPSLPMEPGVIFIASCPNPHPLPLPTPPRPHFGKYIHSRILLQLHTPTEVQEKASESITFSPPEWPRYALFYFPWFNHTPHHVVLKLLLNVEIFSNILWGTRRQELSLSILYPQCLRPHTSQHKTC